MTKFRRTLIAAAALSCFATGARAEDELVIYAFADGEPAADLTASLDGGASQVAGRDGAFVFDLQAGTHSVQLQRGGQTVHAFRFDSAAGQYVDVNVALDQAQAPRVLVDGYFERETQTDRQAAPTGIVTGGIVASGAPLAGASVTVADGSASATTDADGVYSLELPRGRYWLEISHPELGEVKRERVRVVGNVTKSASFRYGDTPTADVSDVADLETIVVTAKPLPRAAANEQFATNVVDTLGVEEIARYGDSEVSASAIRMPAITIEDSRFVFIRGLGGRYLTTTLNGSTMPSTDPTRRAVPLDLFPTNIVESLDINKTFLAEMPGESTGGNLVINTRTFPSEGAGKLSVSLGFIPGLTGDDVYTDPLSGDWDEFGWDDGARDEHVVLGAISDTLAFSDEFSASTEQELRQIGGLILYDDFDLDTQSAATPKGSVALNYGDVYSIGDNGTEFGFFAAVNYKNGWSQKDDGVLRTYSGGLVAGDQTFVEHNNYVEASGLLALGLDVGSSSYQSNTLVSRNTDSKVRVTQGIDEDSRAEEFGYSIDWVERQFISEQLTGEHLFTAAGSWVANWQVTASQATRLAPNRREVTFRLEEGDGIYNLAPTTLNSRYDDLTDDNYDGSFDLKYEFGGADTLSTIKFGGQAIYRERDADSATYGFNTFNNSLDDNSPNLQVSEVVNQETITGDPSTGYAFQDKTLLSDSYEADMNLNSAYASYGLLYRNDYQVIVGVRYEDYEQTTDTFSLQGEQPPVQSVIDKGSWLPSLSLNWYATDTQQLRAAVSRTVARPDFKEAANATYYDEEFDFRVRGNPLLTVSEITNFDLRWENYWDGSQGVSVALFYKDLKDPIERVVQPASGTAGNSRTFQNAESGELYGVEVDGRIDFALNDAYSRSVFVAANASYIDSEVTLNSGETRKLQGQPDYTANLVIGYDDLPTNQQVTLLANQSGDTIVDVGVSGTPDIIKTPTLSLNANYKWEFAPGLTLKAKVNNILDSEVEFTQGGQVFQSYKRGTEYEVGIDWDF